MKSTADGSDYSAEHQKPRHSGDSTWQKPGHGRLRSAFPTGDEDSTRTTGHRCGTSRDDLGVRHQHGRRAPTRCGAEFASYEALA